MFRKPLRKKFFRIQLAQLRGAKKLRERDDPFFVVDTVSNLTEVPFCLKENDFPKALVGSHSPIAETLMRQLFLKNYTKICSAIMQNIGGGKQLSIPIPIAWRKHLADNGIASSGLYCQVLLYFSSFRQIANGLIKSLILLFQVKNPISPACPYVVFVNLDQNNLPLPGDEKSYDIISLYKNSIIRKPSIRKIWAQAKVEKKYTAPDDMIVARSIFPKLASFSGYIRFFFSNAIALLVTVFGLLMGKWWYGYLYPESVFLNYLYSLNTNQLADNFFFNNTDWFHKPLWAHEIEKKGLSVSLYCFSVNMDKFWRNDRKEPDTYGLKIMLWNQFIVWDKQQEDYFKRYLPRATFTRVGYLDFSGLAFNHLPKNGKKILSVFDVTPSRPIHYTRSGYVFAPYSEEMNLAFLEDIIKVFNDGRWEILWKEKRIVGSHFISNAFLRKRLNLVRGQMIKVEPGIAATSLVEVSDAVISIPFSSPSLISKVKGIPSVFYDTSGKVRKKQSYGLPVLKSKAELKEWFETLSVNHTVDIND